MNHAQDDNPDRIDQLMVEAATQGLSPEDQAELVKHLETSKVDVMLITVHSEKGHDSFLLEPDLYTPHISWLLSK